jgi:hypothetical protein
MESATSFPYFAPNEERKTIRFIQIDKGICVVPLDVFSCKSIDLLIRPVARATTSARGCLLVLSDGSTGSNNRYPRISSEGVTGTTPRPRRYDGV